MPSQPEAVAPATTSGKQPEQPATAPVLPTEPTPRNAKEAFFQQYKGWFVPSDAGAKHLSTVYDLANKNFPAAYRLDPELAHTFVPRLLGETDSIYFARAQDILWQESVKGRVAEGQLLRDEARRRVDIGKEIVKRYPIKGSDDRRTALESAGFNTSPGEYGYALLWMDPLTGLETRTTDIAARNATTAEKRLTETNRHNRAMEAVAPDLRTRERWHQENLGIARANYLANFGNWSQKTIDAADQSIAELQAQLPQIQQEINLKDMPNPSWDESNKDSPMRIPMTEAYREKLRRYAGIINGRIVTLKRVQQEERARLQGAAANVGGVQGAGGAAPGGGGGGKQIDQAALAEDLAKKRAAGWSGSRAAEATRRYLQSLGYNLQQATTMAVQIMNKYYWKKA